MAGEQDQRDEQDAPVRRSDARRNRERILEVALEELTRDAEAPLSTIARKAGVGQATFYRNFPNRDALVLEIYRNGIQQLAEAAPELLATLPPHRALREWMDGLARFAMAKAGLGEALRKATCRPGGPAKPAHDPVVEALDLMLRANQDAGTIRPELTSDDLMLAIAGLWQIDPTGDWQPRTTRLLDLVMDGLRTRPTDEAR
ncbi:TetR/AcrR family transcriptional regulator [Streptomyces sp. NPDC054784]